MEPSAVPRRSALGGGSRYELLVKIATGGTATVYVGRLRGSDGFSRLVAIKRAHPHLRDDPDARRMLVREATLASRIHHANVVPIHDVEQSDDELLLVMSYVEGGSLAELLEAASVPDVAELPGPVALRVVLDACAGLAAVHELTDDDGRALGLVHRDVSPQNVLVGVDGTARLTDFGLAKLTEVSMSSTAGVQGKVAYLAPEYVEGKDYTQASDVFSLGVVAWETLSGRRLFKGNSDADTLRRVVGEEAPPLSSVCSDYGGDLDAVLASALDKDPAQRPRSVAVFSQAIVDAARPVVPATHLEVGAAVRRLLKTALSRRREVVRAAANPNLADTVSVLHDDLPIPARASEPPAFRGRTVEALVEPTQPLDPSLLGSEDEADGILDAETRRLPAAQRDESADDDGLDLVPAVPALPRDRRRTVLLVLGVLVGVGAIALARSGETRSGQTVESLSGAFARIAGEVSASAPAPPKLDVVDVERGAPSADETADAEPVLSGPADPEDAAEASIAPTKPKAPPRRPPATKPQATDKRLPSNPYKKKR